MLIITQLIANVAESRALRGWRKGQIHFERGKERGEADDLWSEVFWCLKSSLPRAKEKE